MKKNVFQGFSENELKNLEMVNGGIRYRATQGSNPDEEAVTAKGEVSPWSEHGEVGGVGGSIDATWSNCKG